MNIIRFTAIYLSAVNVGITICHAILTAESNVHYVCRIQEVVDSILKRLHDKNVSILISENQRIHYASRPVVHVAILDNEPSLLNLENSSECGGYKKESVAYINNFQGTELVVCHFNEQIKNCNGFIGRINQWNTESKKCDENLFHALAEYCDYLFKDTRNSSRHVNEIQECMQMMFLKRNYLECDRNDAMNITASNCAMCNQFLVCSLANCLALWKHFSKEKCLLAILTHIHALPVAISNTKQRQMKMPMGNNSPPLSWFAETSGLKIINTTEGDILPMYNRISNGTDDAYFVSFYMTSDRYQNIDFTFPSLQDNLCLVIRKAKHIPFVKRLLLPFHVNVWICIIFLLILATLVWHVVQVFQPESDSDRLSPISQLGRAFIDTVQVTLTGMCSRPARTLPQRFVQGTLLISVMVLVNPYAAVFFSFAAYQPRYRDPLTLAEADLVVQRVTSYRNYDYILFHPQSGDAVHSLSHKYRPGTTNKEKRLRDLHDIVHKGEDGYLIGETDYEYYRMFKNLTIRGIPMLYKVPECVVSPAFGAYPVRKNMPFYDLLNLFVMRMVEGDLYSQLERIKSNKLIAKGVMIPRGNGVDRSPQPMTRKQLSGVFFLMVFGHGVASAVMLAELFVQYCRGQQLPKTTPQKCHLLKERSRWQRN